MSVTQNVKSRLFVFFGLVDGHMVLILVIVSSLYTFVEVVFDLFLKRHHFGILTISDKTFFKNKVIWACLVNMKVKNVIIIGLSTSMCHNLSPFIQSKFIQKSHDLTQCR